MKKSLRSPQKSLRSQTDLDIARAKGMHLRGDPDQWMSSATGGCVNQGRSCEIRNCDNQKSKSYHTAAAARARLIKPAPPEELLPPGPYVVLSRDLALSLMDKEQTDPLIREYLAKAIRWSLGI